jgi:hypothetical protein
MAETLGADLLEGSEAHHIAPLLTTGKPKITRALDPATFLQIAAG